MPENEHLEFWCNGFYLRKNVFVCVRNGGCKLNCSGPNHAITHSKLRQKAKVSPQLC